MRGVSLHSRGRRWDIQVGKRLGPRHRGENFVSSLPLRSPFCIFGFAKQGESPCVLEKG